MIAAIVKATNVIVYLEPFYPECGPDTPYLPGVQYYITTDRVVFPDSDILIISENNNNPEVIVGWVTRTLQGRLEIHKEEPKWDEKLCNYESDEPLLAQLSSQFLPNVRHGDDPMEITIQLTPKYKYQEG